MNYYNEIKEKLLKSEIYDKVKDYAKDKNKVNVYFEIGRLLHEAGKEYGKNIIKQYSERLMVDVGKKYNVSVLYKMRKFYEIFSNEKLSPVGTILTWSHYRELLVINDVNSIKYYINIAEKYHLSKRELQEKLKNNEYERLSQDAKEKINKEEKVNLKDLVPNPLIIKSNDLKENLSEYALKTSILSNLDEFLLQLGYGFSYVGNEYKIKIGNTFNYIDLLLFNVDYNCYVVIELKVTPLKKEHIGQIQVYMNYIDKNVRKIYHDKTIGIIICKKENKYIIEYASDERIIAREYELL